MYQVETMFVVDRWVLYIAIDGQVTWVYTASTHQECLDIASVLQLRIDNEFYNQYSYQLVA